MWKCVQAMIHESLASDAFESRQVFRGLELYETYQSYEKDVRTRCCGMDMVVGHFQAIYLYVWLVSTFIPSLSPKLSNKLCAKILNFYKQHENRKNVHILSSRIFQSEGRCKLLRFLINLNPDSKPFPYPLRWLKKYKLIK